MPRLALALWLGWFVALFVLRTALQWARTGSTGLKGFRGDPGSLSWLAGVATSLGFGLTMLAPTTALLGWPGGRLLFEMPAVHGLGAILVVSGTAGAFVAQRAMGDAWRVGVDETEQTRLVTSGLFARVRNPIFSFMALSLVGLVLLVPNVAGLVGGLVSILGIELQVRAVEEPYLATAHGPAYEAYAARVGRFVPGIGRRRPAAELPHPGQVHG